MPNLSRLVYVSEATRPFGEAELAQLVDASRRRNEGSGITGLLIHGGGFFVQALEGELEDVADRFDAIRVDARHRKVERLLFEFTAERMFPAWWMGLASVDGVIDPTAIDRIRMIETVRFARALRGSGGGSAAVVMSFLRDVKTQVLRTAPPPIRAAG